MNSYIPRLAEITLSKNLKKSKVVILLGARQTGKTTLLKHTLDPYATRFLNLDVEVDKHMLLAASSLTPADAFRSFGSPSYLVIDEAQRLPQTGRIVKGWYDCALSMKIILSGSSSLDLLDRSVESLTGRNVKVFLPPLVFSELIKTQSWYSPMYRQVQLMQFKDQMNAILLSSLVFGSYPEAVISTDKIQYLTNLVSDYLLKDILQLGLVKVPDLLHKLLALLAHQIGSLVSTNEIAMSLGISRKTVDRYLDLLERTFIIFRLRSYSTNPRKEITKSQKIYFWDTGIRNALIGELQLNPLRSDIGGLWENWVVAEYAKRNMLAGRINMLYFWRSRTGSEVDLIVKDPYGKLNAYEIKWSAKRTTTSFTSLYHIPVHTIHKDNFYTYIGNDLS